MRKNANEPVRMAFTTSTASSIPVWRHQPCMRLKKGMTARRTIMSMGATAHRRFGSRIRNSKRSSQAHTREQRIRPACDTSTKTDRQRSNEGDFLLIVLIARPGAFLVEDSCLVDRHEFAVP